MSKRKGDYITVEDLIEQVGKDATRFIMLSRSNESEMDFDFDKVKEKSKDNPLYYVQYCYARISSVFRHINKKIEDEIKPKNFNFNFINKIIFFKFIYSFFNFIIIYNVRFTNKFIVNYSKILEVKFN